MNERIRLLAEQATTEESDGFKYFDKEKFAELIVKDCAESASYYGNRVRQHVLKHFGVEE